MTDERPTLEQQVLAAELGVATSTVHAALRIPRRAGAVAVGGRGFRVADRRKLLLIWAVFRNLDQDTLWASWINLPPDRVEALMPPEARFTGPSAVKLFHDIVPADYDHVLVYLPVDGLPDVKHRLAPHLPKRKRGQTRLIVLVPDPRLGPVVPDEQVYVDLWQMKPWWAADFCRVLEERIL